MIERLTPEDIRTIQGIMLELYGGGFPGEYEPGLIDFMADKPFDGSGDHDYYPGLFMKAAVYMEGFATKQLFVNANKRTAYMCAKVFLELNGYMLNFSDNLLYTVTIAVAKKRINLETLARLLERHSYPLT